MKKLVASRLVKKPKLKLKSELHVEGYYNIERGTKISDIVNKIVKNYDPDKIILFGSYANGTENEDSDLDFIIT